MLLIRVVLWWYTIR